VADRVDIGFRAGNLSLLGADAKWNMVRGKVDLAIDPGVQGTYLLVGDANAFLMYANLPLLIGINLSENVALLFSPGGGLGYSAASGTGLFGTASKVNTSGTALFGRMGFGANFRVSKGFSIQPEVTALWNPETKSALFSTGIGFSFGEHPDTSDLASK